MTHITSRSLAAVFVALAAAGCSHDSTAPKVSANGFVAVTAGANHTCALTPSGTAYCWGLNSTGQLGDSTQTNRTAPTRVAGGLQFVSIVAGNAHTCALTAAGVAYCWGLNSQGEVGDSTTTLRLKPTAVSGGLAFMSISTNPVSNATCGLVTGGSVFCWGANQGQYLGTTVTAASVLSPSVVQGGMKFASIATVGQDTCGLTSAGLGYCWGQNSYVIGNGLPDTGRVIPPGTAIAGGFSFKNISMGAASCGLSTSGIAYCWGFNDAGEIGDGTFVTRPTPTAVSGGLALETVMSGGAHVCGLTTAGLAYCWGDNSDGDIGDGSGDTRGAPVAVALGLKFASLGVGQYHACGLTATGTAYCWGNNTNGELGIGTTSTTISTIPLAVVTP